MSLLYWTDGLLSDQPNVVGRDTRFLMMQSQVCVLIYLPFEVPFESNTQNADNRRFKIGMHLEIG